ncbi:hypothetical protein LCY76_12405 [Fictibacillus sp. KIGAM418]|uniref:Uncharacterized protein n=1 Tax=Fictibacillus marinisediminis TaxID=2878389 RepID=A0A9X2BCY9_9BACL|nr:hypothetical protein [Fictibacillus marinisediminis]MCK6257394.1 hypothetical protein [Fictibacillus marinisediminis]
MKNHLKIWVFVFLLMSLLLGTTQSTTHAATSKRVLGTQFTNGLVSFVQNGKYGMMDKKEELS